MPNKKKGLKNSMVERIKDRVSKSSSGIGLFFRIPADKKAKVRFITDLDNAIPVTEHDKYGKITPTPCLAVHFEKECAFCKDKELRTREVFCWTVYDYQNKEKKVMKFAGNQFTPVPALITAYETYGTLLDRDYVITRSGTGREVSYGVMPLDKAKFGKKMKPYSEKEILEMCVEASEEVDLDEIDALDDDAEFEDEDEEFEEEDEEEEDEDDEEEFEDDEEEDDDDEFDDDEFEEDDDDDDSPFDDDEDEEEEEKPKKKKKKTGK